MKATTGQRLDAALRTIGWSREAFARHLGISSTSVKLWCYDTYRAPEDALAWVESAAAWMTRHPPPPPRTRGQRGKNIPQKGLAAPE